MSKTYMINEIFYSIQGEGVLAGTPMVFVRFSKCNMECRVEKDDKSPGGFDCDTEFESGRRVTLKELCAWISEEVGSEDSWPEWVLLTGGEPALQVDVKLIDHFKGMNLKLAIETNGSIELPYVRYDRVGFDDQAQPAPGLKEYENCIDHICVSPKVAEHAIRQRYAHEVKYVRAHGQAIPKTVVQAEHYLISPATSGLDFNSRDVQWCIELVKQNPKWRLTAQLHKLWRAR